MKILSIGGSDPSAGAGIQSDVKTFESLGAYGLTVVTSITSQNTKKFSNVEPVSAKMIKEQIDSIFSDFSIDAIKIGMVYNSPIIKAIQSKLKNVKIPIILDPIIESTTKGKILQKTALTDFKKRLIPISHIITPNISEAEQITNCKILKKSDLLKCAKKIQRIGTKNIVITGCDFGNKKIIDFVLIGSKSYELSGKKLSTVNHGSGCNYSASLAVSIAKGNSILNSVKFAKSYAYNSIKNSQKVGRGVPITHISPKSKMEKDLGDAIFELKSLEKFHTMIPECQTNFVYSKIKPKSLHDVLGITGRIVKSGKNVIVAGDLEYGGSKHVASAILEISKKFPKLRSAMNVKYEPKLITKCKRLNFKILSYDRMHEPLFIKKKGSSVSWGIKNSIKHQNSQPDIIYHKGDIGKEAMMLIFGSDPKQVIKKISRML